MMMMMFGAEFDLASGGLGPTASHEAVGLEVTHHWVKSNRPLHWAPGTAHSQPPPSIHYSTRINLA